MPQSVNTNAKPRSATARGALCDEIADALQALWERRRPGDETMHQVRKDLKRARAALRLLREAVGEAAYARENVELRDAARPLAGVRDATVALEVVQDLLETQKKPARRAMLIEVRRRLHVERLHARQKLLHGWKLAAIERSLQDAGQRVEYWRVPLDDAQVLRAGFKRVYRKGRDALKKARSEGSTESLHESRKQVKYLQQAAAIVANGESRRLEKLAKRAQAVADRLGDDHDLAALQAKLAALPGQSKAERKLIARIEARRAKLQKKALKQARRLYSKKPAAFLEQVLAS
jgi:CHAD domain-containing protein